MTIDTDNNADAKDNDADADTDDETIMVIRHLSQQGETFIWLLTNETAPTVEEDLRRLWMEKRLGFRECCRIAAAVGRAVVRV